MSRPKKEVALVDKIAQAFAAVERLQRKGEHPRGFRYTRAHDVFNIVRGKLLDRGVLVCPVEGLPEYISRESNGGELLTECRLQVTYTFQDAKEKLDPPLVINGFGRSVGDEALEIAQTKAQKSLLKRFGIMADEQDDAPAPGSGDDTGESLDDIAPMRVPRSQQPVTESQIRAFTHACEDAHKSADEVSGYLLTTHKVATIAQVKRGKPFTECIKWATDGQGTLAPKPQAAPPLQGSLPLPKSAPSFEMRVGGKTHTIEPKTGSFAL